MSKYILTIDQGTTGTTVSLLSERGRVKCRVNQEFRQIFPQPGWVEHDPKDIWRSVLLAIKKCQAQARVRPAQIASLGITNQRETLVAWNRKTGETLGNCIVWQCRRTAKTCQDLRRKGLEPEFQRKTGLVLDPYFSGTKMHWVLKNRPGARALAKQGQLCFGTIDSYLVWKLTRGQRFVTDVSNASRTLLLNLETMTYDPDLLKVLKLKKEMLPEILPSSGVFGHVEGVSSIVKGTPITGVIGDQQSALFGQQCFQRGAAKITFGTGSFLLMNTGLQKISSNNGLLTTVAWQLGDGKGVTYALEGGAFVCGAAVQWLRDGMQFFRDAKEIEALSRKVPDAGGVQFVPAFAGLGAPYWNPDVRGTFVGLSRGTQRAHIARATLEAMALQNVDIFDVMKKESQLRLASVRVDGGAAKNNLLLQIQADVLGSKIQRPKNIESTSLGAGLMAGLGVGLWGSLKDLKNLDTVDKEFRPSISAGVRRKRVEAWRKTVNALENLYSVN